ncbi:response regulator [Arenibaculum pallidiluteum]|uniref:response regulator n=1 Tax=Arenibaculum pallidiluteum TaxID=2812559 RepID=UPI001A96849F|nr:response regulator [Arenibaculum pallidiluteum]
MPDATHPYRRRAGAARRVLVVDDGTLIRIYYRKALERSGFGVDEAVNGIEAMEKLLSGHFDLVIVDINMPKMDGLSFLRALRAQPEIGSLPAIVTSTESAEHDRDAARAAGANFYLTKPVSEDSLVLHAAVLTGASA